MAVLALYPQLTLWRERGRAWAGAYAATYSDEPFYAAYANALRDGRPRRNDPYTGRDDAPGASQPESLFSVQFAGGYAVALPARALGLSTSTAFILLAPLAAFASSLALFWLLRLVTRDDWFAAACVPVVLCAGVLVQFQGAIRSLTGTQPVYTYLPFLRRYLPAIAFPLLFVFCACVWRALEGEGRRARLAWAAGAGAAFAVLVYSYFYLWTAALAWLACLALLQLLARGRDAGRDLCALAVTAAVGAASLAPYFALVSRRAADTDAAQALARTHAPDLLRRPELLAVSILIALGALARRGRVDWRGRAALFAGAFALTPFVVSNQQIVTGRSLQPYHYDLYAANYSALVAAVLVAWLAWRGRASSAGAVSCSPRARKILSAAAVTALGWGLVESHVETRRLAGFNRRRDEAHAAALRLSRLARDDERAGPAGTVTGRAAPPVALWADLPRADEVPGAASNVSLLWAMQMYSSAAVPLAENKGRLFAQLHLTGVTPERFAALAAADVGFRHYLFGWARVNPRLSAVWRPVTQDELRAETDAYARFAAVFDREEAARAALSYVVVRAEGAPDLSRLERFYERDAGERAGAYTIYRVRLRG
jgi:hypothetical protein